MVTVNESSFANQSWMHLYLCFCHQVSRKICIWSIYSKINKYVTPRYFMFRGYLYSSHFSIRINVEFKLEWTTSFRLRSTLIDLNMY
jgi:hypothetical protein